MATMNGTVSMNGADRMHEDESESSESDSPQQDATNSPTSVSKLHPSGGQVIPQSLMTPMVPASSEERGLEPTLQNVVSTVNLGCDLDLMKITFCTRNSEYNPQRFTGVVMRIRNPHTTALVFSSGKMVITGARNEHDSFLAAKKFARIIQKLGFNVKFNGFKVQNIVATYDFRFPVKVELLSEKHSQFSRYEPEIFPGLIYRMVKPRVVLLIFVNGKVVLTGAKNRQQLTESLETIQTVLKAFKKQ